MVLMDPKVGASLYKKLGMNNLIDIPKMPRAIAIKVLGSFDLTEEEREAMMAQLKPPQVRAPWLDVHYDNRLWMTCAWLLGAPYTRIALDKGVSRQTIQVAINRMWPLEERVKGRLVENVLSFEMMSLYKVRFFEHLEVLRPLGPRGAAEWLLENVSREDV